MAFVKLNYQEVKALLKIIEDIENPQFSETEQAAIDKLRLIAHAQELSYAQTKRESK